MLSNSLTPLEGYAPQACDCGEAAAGGNADLDAKLTIHTSTPGSISEKPAGSTPTTV